MTYLSSRLAAAWLAAAAAVFPATLPAMAQDLELTITAPAGAGRADR